MKKKYLIIAVTIVGSLTMIFCKYQLLSAKNMHQTLPIEAITNIGGETIQLEVARTSQQKEIGLMNRKSLPSNHGMLFIFNPPKKVSFWMQNVYYPLDMIFLREKKVKAIIANVPPCLSESCPTYGLDVEVDQVIEIKGGEASKLNLKVNDDVQINYLK